MTQYEISTEAKDDLFRIYKYGVLNFGEKKVDEYYNQFFNNFERIAENPFSFPSAEYIKKDYRKSISGLDTIYFKIKNNMVVIVFIIRSQDIGKAL